MNPELRKNRIPFTRPDKQPLNNIDNVPLVYSDTTAQRKLPLKAIDSSLNSGLGSCLIKWFMWYTLFRWGQITVM